MQADRGAGVAADGRLTMTGWLVCAIAAIGFAFDIYELLMLPLVIKPALAALGGAAADGTPLLVPGSPAYTQWARALFFVPALAGGVFGPPPRAHVQHPAVCVRGPRGGLRHVAPAAPLLPLPRVHRRVRGVRSGGGVARRTVSRP
jgi:hypothetical protein